MGTMTPYSLPGGVQLEVSNVSNRMKLASWAMLDIEFLLRDSLDLIHGTWAITSVVYDYICCIGVFVECFRSSHGQKLGVACSLLTLTSLLWCFVRVRAHYVTYTIAESSVNIMNYEHLMIYYQVAVCHSYSNVISMDAGESVAQLTQLLGVFWALDETMSVQRVHTARGPTAYQSSNEGTVGGWLVRVGFDPMKALYIRELQGVDKENVSKVAPTAVKQTADGWACKRTREGQAHSHPIWLMGLRPFKIRDLSSANACMYI